MGVKYTYDDAGRLVREDYTDGVNNTGARIERDYDDADRLVEVEHWGRGLGGTIIPLSWVSYVWNADNTLYKRTEYDATGVTAQTTEVVFGYDARQRLISETRTVDQSTVVYNITYQYDQLGNRTRMEDTVIGHVTEYLYDTNFDCETETWPTEPFSPTRASFFDEYPTRNNRLLEYRVYVPGGQSGIELARTVMYTYYKWGDTAHITIKDEYLGEGPTPEEYDLYYDLNLVYAKNHKLWLAVWQDWVDDTPEDPFPETGWMPDNLNDIWEFRFDGGRQRYLAREWEPAPEPHEPFWAEYWTPASTLWTDYMGNSPYVDYTASWSGSWQGDEQTRYLPGMGTQADLAVESGTPGEPLYYHGDLIGSTMLLTGGVGQTVNTAAYTAFGEYIAPNGDIGGELPSDFSRYGYAGAHGYESGIMIRLFWV